MKNSPLISTLVALTMAASPLSAEQGFLVQEDEVIHASNPSYYAMFGYAMDVDGDVAFVGSKLKGGYVLRLDSEGIWQQEAWVKAPLDHASMEVGEDVAISGSWAFIGDAEAPPADGIPGGKVHVYQEVREGTWMLRGSLSSPFAQLRGEFGAALAIEGDRLVVGAPGESGEMAATGAVYVFQLVGASWELDQRLVLDGSEPGDRFGDSVAIDGDRLVAGATGRAVASGGTGVAAVFDKVGSSWEGSGVLESGVLTAELFGYSVDVRGSRVVVGAHGTNQSEGSVHVFEGPGGWHEAGSLVHPNPQTNDMFGWDVVLGDDWVAIGAPGDRYGQGAGFGTAWIAGPGHQGWQIKRRVVPSQTQVQSFGRQVGLHGRQLLVGAPIWTGEDTAEGVVYASTIFPSSPETFCSSTPSTTGHEANLWTTGGISEATDDLVLWVGPVPEQPGFFIYGNEAVHLPFGSGIRCVGGSVTLRLPASVAWGGILRQPMDLSSLNSPSAEYLSGSTWYVQAVFRDPADGHSGFNLSSAIALDLVN